MRFTRSHFGGGVWARVLRASASLDFASAAAASNVTATVTVPGADPLDSVIVHEVGALASSLIISGYVSAADTVTVVARNPTGSAIDQAATTYRVTVIKAT